MNPSDLSFAHWIQNQNVQIQTNSIWKLFSIGNKSENSNTNLEWIRYNLIIFTIMDVTSIERTAIGLFNHWIWTDISPKLNRFIRSSMLPNIQTLGCQSNMSNHLSTQNNYLETMEKAEEYKKQAMKNKMEKNWREAAKNFQLAMNETSNLIQQCKLRIEYARCVISADKGISSFSLNLYRESGEVLIDEGQFSMAARFFHECGKECSKSTDRLILQKGLLMLEKTIDCHTASQESSDYEMIEAYEQMATILIELESWNKACDIFSQIAKQHVELNKNPDASSKAHFRSVLCFIAIGDIVATSNVLDEYTTINPNFLHSRYYIFLCQLLEEYDRQDSEKFSTICFEFDQMHHLLPWEVQALTNLKQKIHVGDIR